MSDDATPDLPSVLGYRLTIEGQSYDVRFDQLTGQETRALRLSTLDPAMPGSEWDERALVREYEITGLTMEGIAAHMFLARLQRGERPNFNRLLGDVKGNTDLELEPITAEVAAADPPA